MVGQMHGVQDASTGAAVAARQHTPACMSSVQVQGYTEEGSWQGGMDDAPCGPTSGARRRRPRCPPTWSSVTIWMMFGRGRFFSQPSAFREASGSLGPARKAPACWPSSSSRAAARHAIETQRMIVRSGAAGRPAAAKPSACRHCGRGVTRSACYFALSSTGKTPGDG